MNGEMLLKHAAEIVASRRGVYGEPAASMDVVAKRWSLTLGTQISAAQVVLCLIDLKLVRLSHDPAHVDSAIDIAGYSAVLREVTK